MARTKVVELKKFDKKLIKRVLGPKAKSSDYEDLSLLSALHMRSALRAIFGSEKEIPKNYKLYIGVEFAK